jgi:hypothetical protein
MMATTKKKDGEEHKVVTADDSRKARNNKKAANLRGTDSGMFSGMKKGDHADEQPAR